MGEGLSPLPFGIIGPGRVGGAIGRALAGADHPAAGVAVHSQAGAERANMLLPAVPVLGEAALVDRAGLLFLTVPDDVIEPLATRLAAHFRPGQIVVHTAGSKGPEALAPAADAGALTLAIHPVMTFTGTSLDVTRMRGAPFAITTPPGLEPLARALVDELGGVGFSLPAAQRPLYHAALSHAANHLTTLITQARQMLAGAGVEPEILGPLARAALEGALADDLGALTGPASRGDAGTLGLHVTALSSYAVGYGQAAADLLAAYRDMAGHTLAAARRRGLIDAATQAAGLEQLGVEK
jgi:predicted short-subunit dehydrogenase-like oxidoreductase (DUF2520 family)